MPKFTQREITQGLAFELDALDCSTIGLVTQFCDNWTWTVSAQTPNFIPDKGEIPDKVGGHDFYDEFGRGGSYNDIFDITDKDVGQYPENYELKQLGKAVIAAAREKFVSKELKNIYLQNCIFFAARQGQTAPKKQQSDLDRPISQLFPSSQIENLFSVAGYFSSILDGRVFVKPNAEMRMKLKILKTDNDPNTGYVTCELDSNFTLSTIMGIEQGGGVVSQTITFYADRSSPPKIEGLSCSFLPLNTTETANRDFSEFTNKVKSIVENKVAERRLTEAANADSDQIKAGNGKKANKLNSFIRSRSQINKLFMGKKVPTTTRTAVNNETMLMLFRSIAGNAAEACRACVGRTSAAAARNELAAMENCEKALNRIFDRGWKHPFGYNFRSLLNNNDNLIKQIVVELIVPAAVTDASGASTSAAAAAKVPIKYPPYVVFSILSRLNKLNMTQQETRDLVGGYLEQISKKMYGPLSVASSIGRPVANDPHRPSTHANALSKLAGEAEQQVVAETVAETAAETAGKAADKTVAKGKHVVEESTFVTAISPIRMVASSQPQSDVSKTVKSVGNSSIPNAFPIAFR